MKNDKSNLLPRLVRGNQPAYLRVYETFRDAVRSGQLVAGQRVPSSRELALKYGMSRITVTQGYEQLIAEGYLETRRGAGTFVAEEMPDGFFRVESGSKAGGTNRVTSTLPRDARYIEQPPFLSGCSELEAFPMELWLKLYAKQLRASPYANPNTFHLRASPIGAPGM